MLIVGQIQTLEEKTAAQAHLWNFDLTFIINYT